LVAYCEFSDDPFACQPPQQSETFVQEFSPIGHGLLFGLIQKSKLVTRRHQRAIRRLQTQPIDPQPRLADTHRQAGEVAVRRHDAKPAHAARVQQLHRVDDERAVGRVLAARVLELLHGPDGEFREMLFPGRELGRGPVAVSAAHRGVAPGSDRLHDGRSVGGAGVLCVDEYCESGLRLCGGGGCHVPGLFR
jgi:hypothetical protein